MIYIKAKTGTYGNKGYANFHDLNVSEFDIEREFFTAISIDSLLVYKNKYHLQVHLDNCAYKNVSKRMIDYLGENPFETDENLFLIDSSYKCYITIELI